MQALQFQVVCMCSLKRNFGSVDTCRLCLSVTCYIRSRVGSKASLVRSTLVDFTYSSSSSSCASVLAFWTFFLIVHTMDSHTNAFRWCDADSDEDLVQVVAVGAAPGSSRDVIPPRLNLAASESCATVEPTPSKYSVLMFLNVFTDIAVVKQRSATTVASKLGLDEAIWNVDFADAKVVDVVVCGVAPKPGKRHDAISASIPCVTFVLIETRTLHMKPRKRFSKGDRKLKGYSPSSVTHCDFAGTRNSFAEFSQRRKVGLHVFLHTLEYPSALVYGLEAAIRAHEEQIWRCSAADGRKKGIFKTHYDKLVAFAKITQRLVNILKNRGSGMSHAPPLQCAPCQLGFADAEDWNIVGCSCQDHQGEVDELLRHSCTCGLMPLKNFDDPHGYVLPEDELKNVLVHNLKEEMLQRFLSGASVDKILRGCCESIDGDAPDGLWHGFSLEHPSEESAAGESLRNHICLLLDEQKMKSILDEHQRDIPGALCGSNVHLHIPLSVFVTCGSFHLVNSVHVSGDALNYLSLSGGTQMRGNSILMVGPYVGNVVYALQAIMQTTTKKMTFALHDLYRRQLVPKSEPLEGTRYLAAVSTASIAKIASRRGVQLRDDQMRCLKELHEKPYLEACAGYGKSLLASLILTDIEEATAGKRQKLFFLTPNRDQRQSAVRDLRKGMADPLQVVGIGRPSDANPTTDDHNSFDADTEIRLDELLQESKRRIEILEVEVNRAFGGDGCPEAPQDSKLRALEALAHARFELIKQREALLLETFAKASILCMTLDGFLQFIAGRSSLSHLMDGYSVALSMIDECQQIPAEHLAAVACNSNEIVCIFDRQQAMPIAAENQRDICQVRSEGSFLFSSDASVYDWHHAAGLEENQILRLWELVPADATQGPLNITQRFGSTICKHLRRTTAGYYVASEAPYKSGGGIYSVCEAAGYDGTYSDSVRRGTLQATVYAKNSYHGVDSNGRLRPTAAQIPRSSGNYDVTEDRVGLCRDVLCNLLHEGLTFAAGLQFDAASRADAPILTLIWHNKARLHFEALIQWALRDPATCSRYNITVPEAPDLLWQVKTPNTVASKTVELVQVVVISPTMCRHHVQGHLKSERRKTVAVTRAKQVLAYHLAQECMETATQESPWFALYADLKSRRFDGLQHSVVGTISTPISGNYVPDAIVPQTLTAFRELLASFANVVTLSEEVIRSAQQTMQAQTVPMSLMDAISKGLFAGESVSETEEASGATNSAPLHTGAMLRADIFSKDDLGKAQEVCKRVLHSAPAVFGDGRATVQLFLMCDEAGAVALDDMEILARFFIALTMDIVELRQQAAVEEVS